LKIHNFCEEFSDAFYALTKHMRLLPDADTAKECIIVLLVTQIKAVTVLFECKVCVNETRRRRHLLPSQTRNCEKQKILFVWTLLSDFLNGTSWQGKCYFILSDTAQILVFMLFVTKKWTRLHEEMLIVVPLQDYRIRSWHRSCGIPKLFQIWCKQNNVVDSWWQACPVCYKWKRYFSVFMSYHCWIHQCAACWKYY
jgi:hypothetical protein